MKAASPPLLSPSAKRLAAEAAKLDQRAADMRQVMDLNGLLQIRVSQL